MPYSTQIMNHLDSNELISHSHHGAVRRKSTQSLVTEIHDKLLEDLTNDTDTALLILDQSKAYNIISHPILLRKLEVVGFKSQAIKLMTSYLENRKQFVQVKGHRSDKLLIGPRSVIQGSTMSCIMLLIIYIYGFT